MDAAETGGAGRYVAIDLCSKVQRHGRGDPMEYLTAEGTIPLQLYGYEAGLPWCRKDGQEFPEGLRHEKDRQYREGINGQHLLRECCRCRRQDHRAHAARFGPAAIFELPVDSPPGRPNAEGPIACKARLSTLYASGYLVDCYSPLGGCTESSSTTQVIRSFSSFSR